MTKWELSFQQGRSVLRVSNPSHETHGKTKLHIPMKKKEKDEGGGALQFNVLAGNKTETMFRGRLDPKNGSGINRKQISHLEELNLFIYLS